MSSLEEVQSWVASLDATLLPCLPARELQAADRSTHPSHHVDVERHAREFMESAKQLQVFFIRVQHEHQAPREEILRKEISSLQSEIKEKEELIERQKRLLQGWRDVLNSQKLKHIQELERI